MIDKYANVNRGLTATVFNQHGGLFGGPGTGLFGGGGGNFGQGDQYNPQQAYNAYGNTNEMRQGITNNVI